MEAKPQDRAERQAMTRRRREHCAANCWEDLLVRLLTGAVAAGMADCALLGRDWYDAVAVFVRARLLLCGLHEPRALALRPTRRTATGHCVADGHRPTRLTATGQFVADGHSPNRLTATGQFVSYGHRPTRFTARGQLAAYGYRPARHDLGRRIACACLLACLLACERAAWLCFLGLFS